MINNLKSLKLNWLDLSLKLYKTRGTAIEGGSHWLSQTKVWNIRFFGRNSDSFMAVVGFCWDQLRGSGDSLGIVLLILTDDVLMVIFSE